MKLYATVSSERASKGQGGNNYLHIVLKVEDRDKTYAEVWLYKDGELEVLNGNGVRVFKKNAVELSEARRDYREHNTCNHEGAYVYHTPYGDMCERCDKRGEKQKGVCYCDESGLSVPHDAQDH